MVGWGPEMVSNTLEFALLRRLLVLQESVTFSIDPMTVYRQPWIGYRMYHLFLLATFTWVGIKILRVWVWVPPFSSRAKRPPDPGHLQDWRRLARSLARWAGLVLVAWGLIASIGLYRMAAESLQFANHTSMVFSVVGDLASSLAMALFVVLVLYLFRWRLLARLERHEPLSVSRPR